MAQRFYTIGMAGHIDHGKTELTKALTQVDTDRLQEEKDRHISIELGYAPFHVSEGQQASIIDVPGHEKFIRQMIAGVAGIDLVIIVVAADEGVMPQTKEHIEILSFLGIHHAIIAVTKSDKADDDQWLALVKDDIDQTIAGTPFENTEIFFVDSISRRGISDFTKEVKDKLKQVPRKNTDGPFRLPIDQVFTIQGKGTVVRGTIFAGHVHESDILKTLPRGKEVRVRQIQVQHQVMNEAEAGQRAALNLGGISWQQIHRGDVLVGSDDEFTTRQLDVSLHSVSHVQTPLKQRSPVKIHVGTAIVMGRIIFFDRNKMASGEDVLCQLQLQEALAVKRGERFIIRRPSPIETLGGGWVIDAQAEKHRFNEETIDALRRKKEGTPEDRLLDILMKTTILTKDELRRQSGLSNDALLEALHSLQNAGQIQHVADDSFVIAKVFWQEQKRILNTLKCYHEQFPLRAGMDKAEIIHSSSTDSTFIEAIVEYLKENNQIRQERSYFAIADFIPRFPKEWEKPLGKVIADLKNQGLQVEPWEKLVEKQGIPDNICDDFKYYLLQQGLAYKLDPSHLIHQDNLNENVQYLHDQTAGNAFTLQDAKRILDLSRKYLVPFLELLDNLKFTLRTGKERKWIRKKEA